MSRLIADLGCTGWYFRVQEGTIRAGDVLELVRRSGPGNDPRPPVGGPHRPSPRRRRAGPPVRAAGLNADWARRLRARAAGWLLDSPGRYRAKKEFGPPDHHERSRSCCPVQFADFPAACRYRSPSLLGRVAGPGRSGPAHAVPGFPPVHRLLESHCTPTYPGGGRNLFAGRSGEVEERTVLLMEAGSEGVVTIMRTYIEELTQAQICCAGGDFRPGAWRRRRRSCWPSRRHARCRRLAVQAASGARQRRG